MGPLIESVDDAIGEIMNLHRSLPPRPSIEEVEAAVAVVRSVDKDRESRLDAISKQKKGAEIPEELFFVLQEMQRSLVQFQSREQKREAVKLLDLENAHVAFDELIQRASGCVPSSSSGSGGSSVRYPERVIERSSSERLTRDDSHLKKAKPSTYVDNGARTGADLSFSSRGVLKSSMISQPTTSGEDNEKKLSLIRLAALIEVSSKKGTKDIDLRNKLADQIDWLPDSLGKLSTLISLDLSENRIVALPTTISNLTSLTKLDLHSNRIAELPDAIGDMISLLYLDLRGNDLTSLPSTFGRLVRLAELDLSCNRLAFLPDTIGDLINLKKLNVETNDIEELPYTIGNCTLLVELRADYNRLKCLPEAVGKLELLEVLTARYNNISRLPTTMASLTKLREMDVSFNELESIPESLCLATALVKLNIGNNFANLLALPRSIGNLEKLEELDMSNNQIRVLPDSFAMLSKLRVLHAEENPLEVPPRHIAEMGAQAAVQYMAELIAKRDAKLPLTKPKSAWSDCCFFSGSNKRKNDGWDYVT
ncbi:plant intracellular Ras-group-related LRR protein 4-like [Iris pallida]|uniref:Plant intracellular Ras-group-related LRR protein 4-like n=2 Tax=Iris pallida TaxID=29817 RepID=A0AAX6GGR9_IRIPA|nr:plant intracellular Ras-group-related LRR protein 4-like [Iris pallida]